MLALLIALQIQTVDSAYTTAGLRRLVASAAAANRPPAGLAGYRVTATSDIAILVSDAKGLEHATQLEQVASDVVWNRSGRLDQRIIGYRSRATATLSVLTAMRAPWIVPTLYGDRLQLLFPSADSARGPRKRSRRALAVHPLAADRDAVYRFSGGDTILTMHFSGRTIPVVHVRVTPRTELPARRLVFRGDMYLDASRNQIVRLRGEILVVDRQPSLAGRMLRTVLRAYMFMDVVEGEFNERFWLPNYERIEIQARSGLSEDYRPVVRIVTRMSAPAIDSSTARDTLFADSMSHGQLTYAPNDSVNAFKAWTSEIGADATAVNGTDFDDVASESWSPDGPPRLEWAAEHMFDVLRYDKIEGLYTGVSARIRFRDAAPGLAAVGHAGWAWAEHTVRGAAAVRWRDDRWRLGLSAQRELVNTNDFVPTLEGPATISALSASIDDYDYVGRAQLTFSIARATDEKRHNFVRFEVGPGRDTNVTNHVTRGLIRFDSLFRPNRVAANGSYMREAVTFEMNPGVSGEYLEPGMGISMKYERGDGSLRWQRVDARFSARHVAGPITYAGRADAAAVFGGSPPQQLIEFGENEGMPGYGYKEFGGDRVALGHVSVSYGMPFLRAPVHLLRWLTLPGPSPSLTFGMQGGWAAGIPAPPSRPTDGVRGSVAFSLDFFGGAFGFGVARPIDHSARWVFILGSSQ